MYTSISKVCINRKKYKDLPVLGNEKLRRAESN